MDGNYNKQYFIHSSNEESSIDLHDSRISQIQLADDSISFYFPDGVYLTSNGEKTKETIVKLIIEPENINVYVSKEHRSLLKRRGKYITKYIDLNTVLEILNNKNIELIDFLKQGNNHYVWRGVFVDKKGYKNCLTEFQFVACKDIQWEIYFN